VVYGSGGSTAAGAGACNAQAIPAPIAAATGEWLRRQGIRSGRPVVVQPLPLHHVSGLLPLFCVARMGAYALALASPSGDAPTRPAGPPSPADRKRPGPDLPGAHYKPASLMADPAG